MGVGPIEDVPKETSWTSQVRIYNPKGRHSVCSVLSGQLLPQFVTEGRWLIGVLRLLCGLAPGLGRDMF